MSHDVVALLAEAPARRSLIDALVEAGPDLRVRSVSEGAVIELRDGSGRLVAAMQAAQKLALSAEADRLLTEGVGDDLPAQPYWVEARGAELADADTAAMVHRFARNLVDRHGGAVWVPESRMARDDGHLTGATDHPAVTTLTEKAFVVVQDRPLVPLSGWLVDATAAYGRGGRHLQLVTPSTSRITHALRSLLARPAARWVVRDGDGGYYDGFSGVPLVWDPESAFTVDPDASAAEGPHPDFRWSEADGAPGTQLLVDLQVLHPADRGLLLGGAAEILAEYLAGSTPALWGTSEPLAHAWNRGRMTGLCRRRAPGSTWIALTGRPEGVRERGARPIAGTQRVSTVPDGVRESITLAVGHPPGEEPDLSGLADLAGELTANELLRGMTVQRLLGRPDLTYAPRWSGPPVPVGLAVGVEGVSEMGTDHALSAPVRGVPIGPPLTPAVWYRVGDGTEPGSWDRFRDLMSHLRPAD
ncbi:MULTISPECIES: DUF6177 family protein [Nocardiopsis]|uniref:Uncharacterized protein n=1 Tax=Nocardiopsis sinuspersici TaxID=501010 RepID=A0A1V3C6L8_9ACTN|nr:MULTISPECIES: DUF6177 family protein [Nocardiopsis]OOC56333.1 hypothetical protein NOSIN_22970 [Nocardiopsis sinuspersici]